MGLSHFLAGRTRWFAAFLGGALLATASAHAHPHVWVAVETKVLFERGTITGIEQRWTFDELYSMMAIEGLDANKDGVYDRAELDELVKVNLEGLKDFGYFTVARLGDQKLELGEPSDAYMEYKPMAATAGPQAPPSVPNPGGERGGFWANLARAIIGKAADGKPAEASKPHVLSFVFRLPLKQKVLAEAKGFNFSTFDPTFFIAFDLAKVDKPITLGEGAPAGCTISLQNPTKSFEDVARLGEGAFAGGMLFGLGYAKFAYVSCPG